MERSVVCAVGREAEAGVPSILEGAEEGVSHPGDGGATGCFILGFLQQPTGDPPPPGLVLLPAVPVRVHGVSLEPMERPAGPHVFL